MSSATTAAATTQDVFAMARAAGKARKAARAPFDADAAYRNVLNEIKMIIEAEYPSTAAFCKDSGIDRFNLSKCWPKDNTGRAEKEMSVGLYSRICLALGILDDCQVSDEQMALTCSLRDYLVVNNNGIMKSLVQLTNIV